jgi:hypothetical protein
MKRTEASVMLERRDLNRDARCLKYGNQLIMLLLTRMPQNLPRPAHQWSDKKPEVVDLFCDIETALSTRGIFDVDKSASRSL